MKLLLVTGGAGFIGSHIVEHLVTRGYRVRVLDNLQSGREEWIHPKADFLKGDICNLEECRRACDGVSGVFHTAAMSRVGPSFEEIDLYTRVNIVGTQNVLIAAKEAGVKKIIYSGSSTYYGSQPPPHREKVTPPQLLNCYALTKQAGENFVFLFDRLFDLPGIVLRYFNVYGPRQPQSGIYGLVLGCFLERWTSNEALEIHGEGSQRRDFVHVDDVARANALAFESNHRGEVYNIGSGTNLSIKELANLISAKQVYLPRRRGDADATLADITRARSGLGWSPTVSVERGVKDMMEQLVAKPKAVLE